MEYPFKKKLTPAEKKDIRNAVNVLKSTFSYLVQLTPAQRTSTQNVSDGRAPFVEKAHFYAEEYSHLFPGYLEHDDFRDCYDVFDFHRDTLRILDPLTEGIEDTLFVVGAQSFGYSRAFYRNVRAARKNGVKGTDTILDDLSKLFPGISRKKTDPGDEDQNDEGDGMGLPVPVV
ncbi:MAG: hypothetical protein H6581_29695 [Bacteroidia bacterium]|nr:hypothetical protein [Bacteroidia bacterium]